MDLPDPGHDGEHGQHRGRRRDGGLDLAMFADQLDAARRIPPAVAERYGVSAEDLEAINLRFAAWAGRLPAQASDRLGADE